MPERLEDLMRVATDGLRVRWETPETIRRRGGRRRLRWRAAAVFVIVALLGLGGRVVLGSAGTSPVPGPTLSSCAVDLELPYGESEVKLRFYHADLDVAAQAAEDLRNRHFDVVETAATNESTGDNVAVIRFGPAEVGDAWLVMAYLPAVPVSMEFDRARTRTVDLILGPGFTRFNTTTQMRQRIAVLGRPHAPC